MMDDWLEIVIGAGVGALVLICIIIICICKCSKRNGQNRDEESQADTALRSREKDSRARNQTKGDKRDKSRSHSRGEFLDKDAIDPSLVIDLHGHFVKEALEITRSFLSERAAAYKKSKNSDLRFAYIVTGRGLHSEGGKAKIKPEVVNILEHFGLSYSSMNKGGMFKIDMQTKQRNFS